MESRELRAILEELKQRLGDLYGDRLVELVLFGSQARGDAEEGSDIDVLVVLRDTAIPEPEMQKARDIIYELSYGHDTLISCVYMDQEKLARGQGPLVRNVLREGVKL